VHDKFFGVDIIGFLTQFHLNPVLGILTRGPTSYFKEIRVQVVIATFGVHDDTVAVVEPHCNPSHSADMQGIRPEGHLNFFPAFHPCNSLLARQLLIGPLVVLILLIRNGPKISNEGVRTFRLSMHVFLDDATQGWPNSESQSGCLWARVPIRARVY
jgi:hypothetical protein